MFNKKNMWLIIGICVCFIFCAAYELSAMGKKHVILVDPAHGGQDQGVKLMNDIYEKDITLAVAQLIKKELSKESNLEVILTRDSDKTVSEEDRKKSIEKIKPDFFLSLHVNAGFGKNASGFELYYQGLSEDIVKGKKTAKDDKSQVKNKCLNDSLAMAKIVQENLDALFPRKGRGLRKADLPVTDGILVPALVVEMGFATNSEDKGKLLNLKTQVEISKSLAKSIKTFFR
ncbi:MAG TPA: N-acetylmuramoyl-L-alanine amidase [Smithella sp.]|nr:N-acetylmuramoyl-L-alanine amidase [Smithella sp.]